MVFYAVYIHVINITAYHINFNSQIDSQIEGGAEMLLFLCTGMDV